jgi:AraC-like DNA-binding protein
MARASDLENLGIKYCSQPAMERSELRAVLVASLSENPPRSVAEISRRLRFRRPQTLWSREPELCKQIARRRRDSGITVRPATQLYPRSQGQHLEGILREHLEQDPLSLNEIASRLGYKGSGAIRERFSDLCRAITAKRKQQVLRKREGMRVAIETARTEIAPPSLREIGRRLGYTVEFVVVKTDKRLVASQNPCPS